MIKVRILLSALVGSLLLFSSHLTIVHACTGIRLSVKDGSAVYGRTMEWGTFDLNSRVAIIPHGYEFTGLTPDGHNGKKWKSKYGVIGLDMLGKDLFADGMNEKGLAEMNLARWLSTNPDAPQAKEIGKHIQELMKNGKR